MSTVSRSHPLPAQAQPWRRRSLDLESYPRRIAGEPELVPAMGPANRAPGVPIMGLPSRGLHAIMGAPDAGQDTNIMGPADHGTRMKRTITDPGPPSS